MCHYLVISAQKKQGTGMEGRGDSYNFYEADQGGLSERVTFDLKESEAGAM